MAQVNSYHNLNFARHKNDFKEFTWEGPQAQDRVQVIEGEEAEETITAVTDTGWK